MEKSQIHILFKLSSADLNQKIWFLYFLEKSPPYITNCPYCNYSQLVNKFFEILIGLGEVSFIIKFQQKRNEEIFLSFNTNLTCSRKINQKQKLWGIR